MALELTLLMVNFWGASSLSKLLAELFPLLSSTLLFIFQSLGSMNKIRLESVE